ncbi:uncharacterized protein LOC141533810 isoform X2 [Cotesia typhae]|uniref:uncharacterized protein LOC141533810 isoform X2 n=1 Tax=Cotesia typhae TaxID=2053667 RepID=UPI003D68CF52
MTLFLYTYTNRIINHEHFQFFIDINSSTEDNNSNMDEHLMNDEQFLAHQMQLARVADNVDEGMDRIFEDGDDMGSRLENPIDRQGNDQAGNGGVAQDGNQNHDNNVTGQHNRQVINPGIGRDN